LAICQIEDWTVTVAGLKLRVQNLKDNNRKLLPKMVLQTWRGGRMEEAATAAKQFVIAKANELVVTADGKGSVVSLAAFAAAQALTGVYQHGKCPAGKLPDKLVNKKAVGYVPSTAELGTLPAVIAAAAGSSTVKVVWLVAVADLKAVPVGLALITMKQLVVPGSQAMDL
jgi:hypothetical protein